MPISVPRVHEITRAKSRDEIAAEQEWQRVNALRAAPGAKGIQIARRDKLRQLAYRTRSF